MKARIFGGVGLVILIAAGIIAYLSLFVVHQTEQALVLRFGEPVRVILQPGLYTKLPLIDNVEVIDARILDLDSPPLEIIASDQKRLVVDAFGRYKVVDPLLFYQSVGSIPVADQRLSVLLNSAVRQVLGEATFQDVVRDQRDRLMGLITQRVDREGRGFGLEVVDVRIRRADLPEANSQAIYQRMQTERQREATEIRARGEEAARRIRAEADRTATVIIAEANRESEQIRGDGDAARSAIFADAYGANPEFFDFYRSMQAYETALKPSETRFLISPDSEFFRYFGDATGGGEPSAAPTQGGAEQPGALIPEAPDAAPSPGTEATPPAPEAAPETTGGTPAAQ